MSVDLSPVESQAATEEPPHDRRDPAPVVSTRSPRALGRLLIDAVVVILVFGMIQVLDRAMVGLRIDAQQAADHLPGSFGNVVDAVAIAIAALALLGGIVEAWLRRWWQMIVTLLLAPALAGAVVALVGPHLHGAWSPATSGDIAVDAVVAAGAAVFTMLRIGGRASWHRWLSLAFVAVALTGGAWVTESIPGRAITLAAGGALGALVALALGTPSRRVSSADLVEGLERQGFAVKDLEPQGGDARGSVPWVVHLETGSDLFVKTYSDEERIADLLFRIWRGVRLRGSGDARPHSTLQHAVEHEAFAASRASSAGARVPRVLALGTVDSGAVFAVHEAVDGRSLDRLVADDGPDALTDSMLREAWSMVRTLHRSGVAHRDLRSANIVVDGEGQVWLVDFAFSDVMADEETRDRDLVEFLASTADLVGTERALDAAIATLGNLQWEQSLPMVQPLAVSSATRQALGRKGFSDLRADLALRLGAPEPELPRLARVDRKTIITLVALTAAVWVLLPQIGQSGDLWDQIPHADKLKLALAALASMLTYVGATSSLKGAVAEDLPTGETFEVQLASSFTNRVTPAKVGGVALNARWLVRQGVPSPAAAAAVSINTIAGLVVHITLTIFTVVWAGKVGLGDLHLPSARTIGLGLLMIAAVIGLTYAIPPLRSLVSHRVVPRARQSAEAIQEVAKQPGRLVMLFAGSAFVTFCYITALALSLSAVGAHVPLSTVALVYLAGSALATAAPTPGGLGATEAVFAAALTTTGVAREAAVPAVLLYRFVTFWLPILPGWIAFTVLQRADRL